MIRLPRQLNQMVLYFLIFSSGAAGLIYQVAWHKYLAILLGAQARATAIVLAIFLGGISLGYWFFGRWSRWKPWNLLVVFCFVEVILGAWAFIFPSLFKASLWMSSSLYGIVGVNSILIDIFFSILLIGIPTFLMGGTLPLLTQGLSENLDEASQTHARIYGFNTVGACFGCLLAGYVLVPLTDLGFTVTIAGLIDTFVGLMVYYLFARYGQPQTVVLSEEKQTPSLRFDSPQIAILVTGFCSGFYLIALETVFIRLMGLSTGASNYNFTLIVGVFILGLGIGSLVIKNIGNYGFSKLFWNQLAVFGSLFLLYLSSDYWSYGVHVIRSTLRDIPENFYFYQALLAVAFGSLLMVPIGLSGLTLPLCFHFLKDRKENLGLRVGQLYGLNTVGSVLGAILGGYLFLKFMDLDLLFKICVGLSGLTALLTGYVHFQQDKEAKLSLGFAVSVGSLIFLGLIWAPRLTRERNIQPFRHPDPMDVTFKGAKAFGDYLSRHTKLIHWDDGPNTSLGVGSTVYEDREISRTVFVNGKSDGNTKGDYLTTVMLAHIPALLAKEPKNALVIGFGTGVTVGALGLYRNEIERIDVVEISEAILKNKHRYDLYNRNVSSDPRVHFNEMDAFRYLGASDKKFDIIISEPSNPWVAGIENLYSLEFYQTAKKHLNPGAIFAQWIHTYSFNDDLLGMVFRTMSLEFPFVSVFQLKGGDIALVGKVTPFTVVDLKRAAERLNANPLAAKDLRDLGINQIETIFAMEVVPSVLAKAIAPKGEIHHLTSPRLSNEAAKAFFVGKSAKIYTLRRKYKEYFPSLKFSLLSLYLEGGLPSWETTNEMKDAFCENRETKVRYLCEEVNILARFLKADYDPNSNYKDILNPREIASVDNLRNQPKNAFTETHLQAINEVFETYKRFASPIARIPVEPLLNRVDSCLSQVSYEQELYGECLLQKILILETATLPGPALNQNIQKYLEWFPNLDSNSPDYLKLKEARNILTTMFRTSK